MLSVPGCVPFTKFPLSPLSPQVQEAASRGLKFVSVVPQYQPSGSSAAGSRRFKPAANSVEDARDVKCTLGDRSSLENDTPKAAETAATAGVNRRPEPNPGSTGDVPSAQQPGIPSPSSENEAGEFPLPGLQPALDGSEGDPSNGPEELPSKSKCSVPGVLTCLKRGFLVFPRGPLREKEMKSV